MDKYYCNLSGSLEDQIIDIPTSKKDNDISDTLSGNTDKRYRIRQQKIMDKIGPKQYFSWRRKHYSSSFLDLICAIDVLETTYPLGNKARKEISESMAVIQKMKKLVLDEPDRYTLYDLCAGNALTSVISIHLLPLRRAEAIDKLPRERSWHLAKRFDYNFVNIF